MTNPDKIGKKVAHVEIERLRAKVAALEKELAEVREKNMRLLAKEHRLRAVVEAVKEYTALDHSYCGCVGCRKLYEILWKLEIFDQAGGAER